MIESHPAIIAGMEFTSTHARQRFIPAIQQAVSAVPRIVSTATASSDIDTPTVDGEMKGAIADISFLKDVSRRRQAGVNGRGVLGRELLVGIVIAALVPLDMSVVEFEGLLGDVERALYACPGLVDVADDWYVSDTEWNYEQTEEAVVEQAAISFVIVYGTSTADPGRTI